MALSHPSVGTEHTVERSSDEREAMSVSPADAEKGQAAVATKVKAVSSGDPSAIGKSDFHLVLGGVMQAPDNADLMRRVEERLARYATK